jgi:hypothetical protein
VRWVALIEAVDQYSSLAKCAEALGRDEATLGREIKAAIEGLIADNHEAAIPTDIRDQFFPASVNRDLYPKLPNDRGLSLEL